MPYLEPQSTAAILLGAGILLGSGVLLSRVMDRTGVFTGLLFLAVGMLAGEQGPGAIPFDDFGLTFRVGTIALVLILFDGGMNTPARLMRAALGPATVLATFPVLLGVGEGGAIFDVVFFVVIVNAIVSGVTVGAMSRWLGVRSNEPPEAPVTLEITTTRLLKEHMLSFYIDASLAVCGASIQEIPFPLDSAVSIVIRGDTLLAPRGHTRLQPGDYVIVFCKPEDRPLLGLLFGRPADAQA